MEDTMTKVSRENMLAARDSRGSCVVEHGRGRR